MNKSNYSTKREENHTINKSVKTYIEFMKKHLICKSKNIVQPTITHTLMGPLAKNINGCDFKGSYNIDGVAYEKFMKLYKTIIKDNLLDMHIVERPKKVGPLIIDIDFKTSIDNKKRQYFDKHIEYIIQKLNKLFLKYLHINKKLIKAYVFEKPEPNFEHNKNVYKDGFHIIYPEFALDVTSRYYFFNIIKEEIMDEDGFDDIPFVNTYDEIFDSSVINSNGILMYGSHKEGRDPYSLSKIYDHNMKLEKIDNYDNDELISILSIRRFAEEEFANIKKKYLNNKQFMIQYLNSGKHKTQSQNNDCLNKSNNSNKKYNLITNISNKYAKTKEEAIPLLHNINYENIEKIVSNLSVERSNNYNTWLNVAFILSDISRDLFYCFDLFSKLSPKYDYKSCVTKWESITKNNNNTFFHLLNLLKKDVTNTKYREIISSMKNIVEYHDIYNIPYQCSLPNYELQKLYFEQYFCIVTKLAQYIFFEPGSNEIIYYSKSQLMDICKPLVIPQINEENNDSKYNKCVNEDISFINIWCSDKYRKQYSNIDFRPDIKNCPSHTYNRFKYMEIMKNYQKYDKSKQKELIKPILSYIKTVIANNDIEICLYVIKWMANIFRNPENKSNVSLVLLGDKGIGKNFFCDLLSCMLGDNLSIISSDPKTFFDNHSEAFLDKLLVCPDEVEGKIAFEKHSIIKGFITEIKHSVNPKGVRPYNILNFARMVFLSNSECPIKIEPNDRRFVVIKVSSCKRNIKKYWDPLFALIGKQRTEEKIINWEVLSAFYDFLMSIDLSTIDWINDRPITNEHKLIEQKNPIYEWIYNDFDVLFKNNDKEIEISANLFFDAFKTYRKNGNFDANTQINIIVFGRKLSIIPGITKKKKSNSYYVLNKKELQNTLIKAGYIWDDIEPHNNKLLYLCEKNDQLIKENNTSIDIDDIFNIR
jgi:hypothetical protein